MEKCRKRLLWSSIYLVFVFTGLRAQVPDSLCLTEVVQMALKGNINLKRDAHQVDLSRIGVQQAKANFYPNLNASLSGNKGFRKQEDWSGKNTGTFNANLSSDLNLFNGFSDMASLQKSKLTWRADTAYHSWERENLIYKTISQYLSVILNKEYIRIEQSNMEAQQQQLDQINEFMKVGNRSKVDVLQQLSKIKSSEQQLIEAERNYKVSRLELLQIMGSSLTSAWEFAAPDIQEITGMLDEFTPETVFDEGVLIRADIQGLTWDSLAAEKQIKIAKSGLYPSLNLKSSVGSNYMESNTLSGFSDQFYDTNPNASLGLTMSIPIFNRFQTSNAVQKAKIQKKDFTLQKKDYELTVKRILEQSIMDFKSAKKQLDAAQSQYNYAKDALEIMQDRYTVGSATFIELSQLRTSFLNASYQKIRSQYNLLLHWIAVYFYNGRIEKSLDILSEKGSVNL